MGMVARVGAAFQVTGDVDRIWIVGSILEVAIRKKGYVSGVEGGSLRDTKTGGRDLRFGLDIVDWIMEPGRDEAYRDRHTKYPNSPRQCKPRCDDATAIQFEQLRTSPQHEQASRLVSCCGPITDAA